MIFVLVSLVGLVIGVLWLYYISSHDADNQLNKLKEIDIISVGFIITFALSCFKAYSLSGGALLTFVLYTAYISMLISIAYVDIRTGYLYDSMILFYGLILLPLSYFVDSSKLLNSFKSMLMVFVFYGLIYLLSRWYYKREAFGVGDIFFIVITVINMEPLIAMIVAFLAFYIAAIFVLFRFIIHGKAALKMEIAFCPYIALSALVGFLFNDLVYEFLMHILY